MHDASDSELTRKCFETAEHSGLGRIVNQGDRQALEVPIDNPITQQHISRRIYLQAVAMAIKDMARQVYFLDIDDYLRVFYDPSGDVSGAILPRGIPDGFVEIGPLGDTLFSASRIADCLVYELHLKEGIEELKKIGHKGAEFRYQEGPRSIFSGKVMVSLADGNIGKGYVVEVLERHYDNK